MVWTTMKNWLAQGIYPTLLGVNRPPYHSIVPLVYSDSQVNAQFQKYASILHPDAVRKEMLALEATICEQTNSPVVFCHNDLLAPNIIYHSKEEERKAAVSSIELSLCHIDSMSMVEEEDGCGEVDSDISFIDYEYGSYSYRGFDIGNHFNEYAGFECDYSKYPGVKAQKDWIRAYLEEASGPVKRGNSVLLGLLWLISFSVSPCYPCSHSLLCSCLCPLSLE